MEIKHGSAVAFDLEDKALTESNDCYTLTGYASVFGNKDLGGDVVVEGAYAQSLRDHGLPLLLFQHKTDDVPIGCVTEAKENKRGLFVRAELPRDDDFVSKRLIPQLRRRALKGLSVGYRALETEKRPSDGARLLKRIRLYEISVVSMAMNPLATVETVKTMSSDELAHYLEEMGRAARAITEACRPDPVRELADAAKAIGAFVAEARRDRPQLRDPIRDAEAALRGMQARLQRLQDLARGR